MWWPKAERGFAAPWPAAVRIVALALALVAAACNVRPLYAPLPDGSTASDSLRSIEILEIPTRVGQRLRNDLVFGFNGGGEALAARYELKIVLTETLASVSVEQFSDTPAARLLRLDATFILRDINTGKSMMSGSSFASASYDFSEQRYANIRAERDAQNRAARVIADDIRLRIAAHFATADV